MNKVVSSHGNLVDTMSAALLEMGILDSAAVERARRAQIQTSARFDTILTELGLLSEDELADFWARWLDIPRFGSAMRPDGPILEDLLSREFLDTNAVVPLVHKDGNLHVAMADPLDRKALSAIGYLLDEEIRPVSASRKEITDLLKSLYEPVAVETDTRTPSGAAVSRSDVEHLKALANDGPIIQRVNTILSTALERGASDVHLEPDRHGLLVRLRIDGHLQDLESIDGEARAAIVSRVKIMARMDITERRLPQDGRVTVTIRGRDTDLRISTLPTMHGESTVIRLLRRDETGLDWNTLGFTPALQARLSDVLSNPNGIFLVTGPTGSGKTTTLYTALRQINAREKKLISVEDPVEIRLPGINQVQVQSEIGLDFASALRSILRQDPDIVMIGEIRDLETAEIAIRASLTGHLVLSTLHTNNAAAAITRLIEMGMASYLVAACVRAVLSQRLVRILCPTCAMPQDAAKLPAAIRAADEAMGQEGAYRMPVGCPACRGTGYAGRKVICELVPVDAVVRDHVLAGHGEAEIAGAAHAAGHDRLIDDGLRLARQGMTSLEEVLSVAGRSI
ncbi:type II secretion system protein E (GspE) [Breoghania corrubedonensis]|uniref:Type II secretion system protein E (GspE) n=1 Tax=Breoghania corrubedonensis TaxID=665038 RepID=A0A2T5VBC8_9HYPH|nr:GspE/PulE family protein [Breoghania corrubedonensis]PTW61055.1 type II secretion system protein E (GspE) [Breoghania corrubedonensis]